MREIIRWGSFAMAGACAAGLAACADPDAKGHDTVKSETFAVAYDELAACVVREAKLPDVRRVNDPYERTALIEGKDGTGPYVSWQLTFSQVTDYETRAQLWSGQTANAEMGAFAWQKVVECGEQLSPDAV